MKVEDWLVTEPERNIKEPTTRTVLITGATSGFGAAMAKNFAQAGFRVVATGRRADRLRTLVDQFGEQTVVTAQFDVKDEAAMDYALSAIPENFRGVDILINNAGLALGTAPAPQARLVDWLRMIETNITGLVTLTHKLLPILIARRGLIINLSSVAGSYPIPGSNVYGATKAFIRQFSLNLRSDLHGTGVRVTSVEPGLAETEFTLVRTGGDQSASDKLYDGAHPLTAEDIADAVSWIASLPAHVNINRLELMPVSQSWAGMQIYREPPDSTIEHNGTTGSDHPSGYQLR